MRFQPAVIQRWHVDCQTHRLGRLHLDGVVVLAGAAVLIGLVVWFFRSGAPMGTFAVQANQTWQDTGIDVPLGASVRLSADGTWNRDGKPASVAGLEGAPRDLAVLPDAPLMCVLVRIGDDAPHALVQPQGLTSKQAGRLFAQPNDLEVEKNSGSVTLHIEGGRQATDVAPAAPLLAIQELEREYQLLRRKTQTDQSDTARDLLLEFCAKHLGTAQARRAAAEILSQLPPLTNSIGMQFRPIPPGRFTMGDAEIQYATPPHEVTLTRPFFLAAHEVTIGQFRQFVAATTYRTDAEKQGWSQRYFPPNAEWRPDRAASWKNPGFTHSDQHPVVHVSWNDAVAFCDWLSKKEKQTYRLPTEAEWEYACRAGSTTPFFWGRDQRAAWEHANLADTSLKKAYPGWHYDMNPWDDGHANTAPVGRFRANAWGLHDMCGNACEWCADWFGMEYYATSVPVDPPGPATGDSRVLRGGAWGYSIFYARSAFRLGIHRPEAHNALLGFRVMRVIPAGGRP